MRNYLNHSVKERLEIAYYLTGVANRFDMDNPPQMDKTAFYFKKIED